MKHPLLHPVLFLGLLGMLIISLPACQQAHGGTPSPEATILATEDIRPVPVKVYKAERRTFSQRTIATGALVAVRQAEIKSRRGGQLLELPIREGQTVAAGDLLARLDDADLQLKLEQNRLALDEAIVNKKDLLIANGGQAESDTSVSARKLELILTLSGYDKALHAIKQTEHELEQTLIKAPFPGMVADLKTKAFQQVNPGEVICTLIDPESFAAAFSVLEEEALQLTIGQTVQVAPIAAPDHLYPAHIHTINPKVDAQGLVQVQATLTQPTDNRLFEGMNVKVILEKKMPQQLVIPKEAVVLRSGREVVFTVDEHTRKAMWHYVQTGFQNDAYVTIQEGLEAGAAVIYEGHLNLDHRTTVIVQE